MITKTFVGGIKESLISTIVMRQNYWSTHSGTKLILSKWSFGLRKVRNGIKRIVAEKVPDVPVKLIGPGLCDNVDNSTEYLAKPSFIIVRLNFKLLHVVQNGCNSIGVSNAAKIDTSIEQIHIAIVVLTVH